MAVYSHYLALGLATGMVTIYNTLTSKSTPVSCFLPQKGSSTKKARCNFLHTLLLIDTVWACLHTGVTPVTALRFIQRDNLRLIGGCEDGIMFSLLCSAPGKVQLTKLNE